MLRQEDEKVNKGTKGFILGVVVGAVAYHLITQGTKAPSVNRA